MDRRTFRTANDSKTMKAKGESVPKQILDNDTNAFPDGRNLAALRELGNQLQIKAEKMRLLARAEEGLGDGDMNPYTTHTKPLENILLFDKQDVEEQKPENKIEKSKIPTSTARKRRRDKKTKIKGPQPTNIDIKQYRPGYTWNRGGRVKELRIRNLARKFLHIWKKNVFGRVTPSQARNHYRRRLLKLTFGAWHEMWWEMRKEWRLVVRAECHYRYVLWLKTFRAWRDFIVKQRIKNTKIALAEQHASCKLERKCFDAWLGYTHERRNRRLEQRTADEHYNQALLRRHWIHWEGQHELVLHRQHMEMVALQFWAYRIQAQHWLIWQERLSNRKACIQKQFKAVRHHNTTVVQKCLKAWILYWARRRQKKQEKEYALQVYQHHALKTAFVQWVDCFRRKQAILEQQERIDSLAETFQKRRMFVHWKHYIELVHDKQEKQNLAEAHYVRKLKVTGLSAFRLCVVQRRVKIMRETLARELRIKQLTRGAWDCWMARCENNDELKIIAQSQRASKHYRLVLLRKCFDQLQRYCYWRQYRQLQYAKADAHYYMTAMPKYMFRLKVFVQLMKNNRENQEKGEDFRRENLQARFFYLWVNQFEFSKEYRMNERMAILHSEGTVLKRFFLLWKTRTADALQEAENEEIAAEHYNGVLCRNHLKAWVGYIRDIKKSQRQDIDATVHHHKTLMKTCFHALLAYTRARRVRNQKTQRARQHYHRVLCKKMVSMWLHYVDTQRCIKQRAEVMYTRKCWHRMGEAFRTWRENVAEQIRDRQEETVAVIHYKHHVMAKVFKAWHRFTAIHAYKKSETSRWVMSAREHLNHGLLEVYFTKWRKYHREHVELRMKLQEAEDHHGNKVKQKVMLAWKEYTQDSIKKNLLQKQSDWFFKVRVTARCFVSWKVRLAEAHIEKEKSHLALWNWCLCLQRKVFMAWLAYIQQRNHKKSRLNEAMERRRCRLIKNGLTQWLTVADDLSALRKTFAAQQQAKSAYETYQLVLRCGLHWKHWAVRQRQKRGGPKPGSLPAPSTQPLSARGGHSTMTTPRETMSTGVTPRESAGPRKVTPREQSVTPRDLSVIPKPTVVSSPARSTAPSQIEGRRPQLRARPRKPDFLVESLKRAGLYSPGGSHSYEEPDHQMPEKRKDDIIGAKEGETTVERLNLTNLDTDRSERTDCSSVPFKMYADAEIVSQTASGTCRSDLQAESARDRVPVNYTHWKPVHFDLPPAGSVADQGRELNKVDVDVGFQSLPVVSNVNVLKQHSKLQLMTPADFLQKRDQGRVPVNVDANFDLDLNTHSECQSTATTPRVLCQTAGHGHPLSETRSFRVADFRGEITPRSTSSLVTPREAQADGKHASSSTATIQKEIVVIRNRLKSFDQKKKKLRTMQKQLKQLSDWLTDMEAKGHRSDDEDVVSARQEVSELSADVDALKRSVEQEKGQCTGLVDRVKALMSQLAA